MLWHTGAYEQQQAAHAGCCGGQEMQARPWRCRAPPVTALLNRAGSSAESTPSAEPAAPRSGDASEGRVRYCGARLRSFASSAASDSWQQ